MKKLTLLAIILNILAINAATAKEVAIPVSPVQEDLWSGFFGGINLGYAYNSQKVNTSASNVQYCTQVCGAGLEDSLASIRGAQNSYNLNNSSFISGGQLGYNKQLQNRYIVGLTTDFQGITNNNNTSYFATEIDSTALGIPQSIVTNAQASGRIDYLGTLRANLGYLVKPNILIMATGGLSYAEVKSNINIQQNYSIPANSVDITPNWGTTGNYSNTRAGWTAGGTIEWMLRPNWSVNLGYLYYDLGTVNYNSGNLIAPITIPYDPQNLFNNATNTKTHFTGNLLRLGLNYHFS